MKYIIWIAFIFVIALFAINSAKANEIHRLSTIASVEVFSEACFEYEFKPWLSYDEYKFANSTRAQKMKNWVRTEFLQLIGATGNIKASCKTLAFTIASAVIEKRTIDWSTFKELKTASMIKANHRKTVSIKLKHIEKMLKLNKSFKALYSNK